MEHLLYYDRPADCWTESLPLGNGHFGAMVYGGVSADCIKLNHDTLWSGNPGIQKLKDCKKDVEQIRNLIRQERYQEAAKAWEEQISRDDSAKYLPMGTILINYADVDYFEQYQRELAIDTAVMNIDYTAYRYVACRHHRRMYISRPQDVMVMELREEKKELSFSLMCSTDFESKTVLEKDAIYVQGRAPLYIEEPDQISPMVYDENTIQYGYMVRIAECDGQIYTDSSEEGSKCIHVRNASRVTLLVSGETNFVSFDRFPDKNKNLHQCCRNKIEAAMQMGMEEVYNRHIKDYKSLYERVCLHVGEENDSKEKGTLERETTLQRLVDFRSGKKEAAELAVLLFNYARYLMITGSRSGSQPLNLQGIWNDRISAPWRANYTTNINLEMNYWMAESCNLSDCHEPLIKMIRELSIAGENTARRMYSCNGFAVHHNTDLWRKTTPALGSSRWSMWPMAGVWLCSHLYQHYLYTLDLEFLESTAYPITEKCVRFILDYLVEEEGEYLAIPSTSPENAFRINGEVCFLSKMSAMDYWLAEELLRHYEELCAASSAHDMMIDETLRNKAKYVKAHLRPIEIGSEGQLLEWDREFEETEPGHRHFSHLYGLFPGDAALSDEIKEAIKKSLDIRLENGSGQTGWSCGWLINFYAVLKDGDKALAFIERLLKQSMYSNLFDAHPPFQIDGNFALASGVAQMLVQSRIEGGMTVIDILPALPKKWTEGHVSGLRVKGGLTVDIKWKENRIVDVKVSGDGRMPYRIAVSE